MNEAQASVANALSEYIHTKSEHYYTERLAREKLRLAIVSVVDKGYTVILKRGKGCPQIFSKGLDGSEFIVMKPDRLTTAQVRRASF